ncbi:hypothetical protein WMF31_13590 [Sorangium sp. So ce1036]|uniref:hypothetical protein n=1 Tax=Sorangium sp. So ce1036 TaxID=3133328 RepID=UPI003EFF6B7B
MYLTLSRTVLPFLALGAVSLGGCRLDISLGGELDGAGGDGPTSSASVGGDGGDGGAGGSDVSSTGVGGWTPPPDFTPDKVDLLFVVDNSRSMADKQELLRWTTASFMDALRNPLCVYPDGSTVGPSAQPESELDPCPEGSSRLHSPVRDMHIGVISSSLGGHGSTSCDRALSPTNDDRAHLLARSDPQSATNDLPTYMNKGFLVWDPDGRHAPAGDSDMEAITTKLGAMLDGVGDQGCGFEAPLESFYRFLVDPEPHERLEVINPMDVARPVGVDHALLEQRKAFLRPDSLLLIVMLTDENDCSIRQEGRSYLVAETRENFRMWRARSECAVDPNDPCCMSCNQAHPDSCPPDPTCTGPDGTPARLSAEEDPVNLRCWDQKRRFGFDFLYPIERYRRALTEPFVISRVGELVPNPIFSDLDLTDGNTRIRGPQHVVFTGIVGVPWQDIARKGNIGPTGILSGIKNATELSTPLPGSGFDNVWDIILGDPANHIPPGDPFMIESMAPRSGTNPITGDPIVQPDETGWNAINGREYTVSPAGDLQYACTFDIEPRSCDDASSSCDCRAAAGESIDSPVCMPENGNDPAEPLPRTSTQYKAKAYPSIRQLQLLRELGEQGVTGSICPAIPTQQGVYAGYVPVMRGVLDRLSQRF